MKNTLIILMIALPIITVAQPCQYKTNKVDDMTGNTYLETKDRLLKNALLGKGKSAVVYGFQNGEHRSLRFELGFLGIKSIDDGATIMLKDTQGTVHELKSSTYVIAEATTLSANTTVWYLNVVAEGDLKSLEGKKIEKLRFYLNSGFVDFDIPVKKQKFISESVRCLY